ncbi:hypothetical protein OQA88_2209 [Cercophora sp. LCS_1]
MVKPDYSRDYYADLELSGTADAVEVKKQFKKLALKYHPDRNPGKEDQAKEKFVVIQTAHEILTDPALKAKYDANRKRTSYPTASGVRGNPYQNVAKDVNDVWGAPPKRKPAPTRPMPTPYSNWGVPQQPRPQQTDSQSNLRDHLRAWDRMRTSSSRQTPTQSAASASTPNPPPPPPRTAYQARQQEASFGASKKAYAQPQPSPVADEPPAKNQHYTNSHSSNIFAAAANVKNQRPASAQVDPLSEQFSETFLDNRQRTPYASHVGEKLNPFEGATPTRAKSVREQWRQAQESDDDTPPRPQRQRSASVDSSKQQTSSYPNPNLNFTSQASARYSPRPADVHVPAFEDVPNRSAPYSAGTASNLTGNGGASQKTGPNVYGQPFPKCPLRSASSFHFGPSYCSFPDALFPDTQMPYAAGRVRLGNYDGDHEIPTKRPQRGHWARVESYPGTHPDRPPTPAYQQQDHPSAPFKKRKYDCSASPSGEPTPARSPSMGANKVSDMNSMNVFERNLDAQIQTLLRKRPSPYKATMKEKYEEHGVKTHADTTHHGSFAVPDDDDDHVQPSPATAHARFMRNSTDNINTRFVAEEAREKYEFSAGGVSVNDSIKDKRPRTRGRQSPQRPTFVHSTSDSPSSEPQKAPQKPFVFDAENYGIGPEHFVPPPPARQATSSPTRHSGRTKKPKPVKMTAGTAGMVDDEETSGEEKLRPTPTEPNTNGAPSPMAMDIDSPPPGPTIPPPPAGARSVNVEPSKPEWRAGDRNNGTKPEVRLGNGINVPKPPAKPTGSEDIDDFSRPMFSEFKNTEPFAPKTFGLGTWNDLKTTLPFESKASSKLPLDSEKSKHNAVPVDFPHAPICPRPPPALAIKDLKPSIPSWVAYVGEFERYLQGWAAFEKRIAEHFVARQRAGEEKGDKRFAFINTRGDAGIQQYVRDLEQDKYVRQKWMAACEAHELRMREFIKHREKMKAVVEAAS